MRGRIVGQWGEVGVPWRALLAASPATTHAQMVEWSRAVWLADDAGASRWFVAEDDDGPLAVLHFKLSQRGRLRQVANVWWGMIATDGVLAPRCDAPRLGRAVLTAFSRSREAVDFASLTRLRDGTAFHRLASGPVEETRYGGYSTIPTSVGADEWFGAASKNLKGGLRKARNRLEREGGGRTTLAVTAEQVRAAFDDYVALEAKGWKGEAGALANRPQEQAVLREFLLAMAAQGKARLWCLAVDDLPAAANLAAVVGATLVLFKVAYDETLSHLSPGNLLMADVVQACCDDPEITTIDLVTNMAWHDRWNPTKHPTFRSQLVNHRRLGGLAVAARIRLRP